jgi:hypothetical protein
MCLCAMHCRRKLPKCKSKGPQSKGLFTRARAHNTTTHLGRGQRRARGVEPRLLGRLDLGREARVGVHHDGDAVLVGQQEAPVCFWGGWWVGVCGEGNSVVHKRVHGKTREGCCP